MKSLILPPLSVLYGAVTRTRLSLYRRGTFHSTKLKRPVISVGNITTGGTGKTPLVEWIARTVAAEGKKVCILTRGYGRDNPDRQVVVSDGTTVMASPSEAGDEPFLLATNLVGVAAVISNADRIEAANGAIKHLGTDCFVLDDGFQHLRVERDLNIVTIDATNPWGGGHLLPYGRLREPLTGLSRADCVVITRTDQANDLDEIRSEILRYAGNVPVFLSRMRIRNAAEGIPSPVAAFCGVGNPRSFFRQIPHEIVLEKTFPDHHRYSQSEIDSLVEAAKQAGAKSLVTTAKDSVKLKSISVGDLPLHVLEIEPQIDNAAELARLIVNAVKA
ncbi:MAG TPA: tetraacyldisaccharide 4'-kinase [Pyrinomonadaceae bacterium]|nr:tetraacyldisaccharide 4'-kinase [Pyrinomonadaceae bacterium]